MAEYYSVNPKGYGPIAPVFLSHLLTSEWCNLTLNPLDRLSMILSDKVMRFNPYVIDDYTLLECAARGRILPLPSFTQMVIYHFLDIHKVCNKYTYDAIFYRIGNDKKVFHLSVSSLTYSIAHYYTRQPIHSMFNKGNLTNYGMVEKMQNRSFFISNFISGCRPNQSLNIAYRFHRLKGNEQNQAETIRHAMCTAKKEMLTELLKYPESEIFLNTRPISIDVRTPLHRAIHIVENFPSYHGHLPTLEQLY